jgi:uncharacterized protein YqgC (DUF456 family)
LIPDLVLNLRAFFTGSSSMKIISSFANSYQSNPLARILADSDPNAAPGGWTIWLEPTGTVMLAILLVLLCVIAWGTNLIALPGNWFAVALLAVYAWLGPQESRATIGYVAVVIAFLCALLGEVIEFIAAAMGAQRAGASRKSTIYAVVGSVIGAIFGAVIGVPVPVIGSVLAAILFGGCGAAAGAMYGEWTDGRSWKENWSIGHAAFWGRTLGIFGKVSVGLVIVVIAIVCVIL